MLEEYNIPHVICSSEDTLVETLQKQGTTAFDKIANFKDLIDYINNYSVDLDF
mgnify:CR=1 FL=1